MVWCWGCSVSFS